jgi:hypothetical protein
MSIEFNLTPHADHVHVALASGYEITPGGASALMAAIAAACTLQGVRSVLIEGTVARRNMGTMDSFSLGSLVGSVLPGVKIACCFYGYAADGQTQFFKDVSGNRGVRVEFFGDKAAALRWLGLAAAP